MVFSTLRWDVYLVISSLITMILLDSSHPPNFHFSIIIYRYYQLKSLFEIAGTTSASEAFCELCLPGSFSAFAGISSNKNDDCVFTAMPILIWTIRWNICNFFFQASQSVPHVLQDRLTNFTVNFIERTMNFASWEGKVSITIFLLLQAIKWWYMTHHENGKRCVKSGQ